jgi:hypothetical protein
MPVKQYLPTLAICIVYSTSYIKYFTANIHSDEDSHSVKKQALLLLTHCIIMSTLIKTQYNTRTMTLRIRYISTKSIQQSFEYKLDYLFCCVLIGNSTTNCFRPSIARTSELLCVATNFCFLNFLKRCGGTTK